MPLKNLEEKRAYEKAYRERPETKEKRRVYTKTPEHKAKMKAYRQTPEYKAQQKAYHQRPEVKAIRSEYQKRPGVKARLRAYYREYSQRPEVKAKVRERRQTPEAKARQRAYCREYYKKPEVKAYFREYTSAYQKSPEAKAKASIKLKEKTTIQKSRIFQAYGSKCAHCGRTEKEILIIHHIKGGGTEHRKKVGAGLGLYNTIIKEDFPKDKYQIICYICHSKMTRGRPRHHEVEKKTEASQLAICNN